MSAARLALSISWALGLSTARRLRISRLNVASPRLSMSATYGCLPWSMVVGDILYPVVQCAEGLVRRRPSSRHRRGRQSAAAGCLQVAVLLQQSSSASPARAAVGPGALRSGRRRAFDALARARRRVVARPRAPFLIYSRYVYVRPRGLVYGSVKAPSPCQKGPPRKSDTSPAQPTASPAQCRERVSGANVRGMDESVSVDDRGES